MSSVLIGMMKMMINWKTIYFGNQALSPKKLRVKFKRKQKERLKRGKKEEAGKERKKMEKKKGEEMRFFNLLNNIKPNS